VNWLSLITTAAKLIAAVVKFFSDRRLIESGRAEGRAASDADHAREARAAGDAMQKIADKPPGKDEIDKRLEKGDA
jgi:hypothetical protein